MPFTKTALKKMKKDELIALVMKQEVDNEELLLRKTMEWAEEIEKLKKELEEKEEEVSLINSEEMENEEKIALLENENEELKEELDIWVNPEGQVVMNKEAMMLYEASQEENKKLKEENEKLKKYETMIYCVWSDLYWADKAGWRDVSFKDVSASCDYYENEDFVKKEVVEDDEEE
jgi:hypothetical protein